MDNIPIDIQEVLDRFTRECINILGDRVKKIILYGSYARGDYNDSSDIDIMILTDLTDDEIVKYRSEIYDIAYNIEWDNNFEIYLSPLVENIDKFNYWVDYLLFYMNVQKEGIVLSDRDNK